MGPLDTYSRVYDTTPKKQKSYNLKTSHCFNLRGTRYDGSSDFRKPCLSRMWGSSNPIPTPLKGEPKGLTRDASTMKVRMKNMGHDIRTQRKWSPHRLQGGGGRGQSHLSPASLMVTYLGSSKGHYCWSCASNTWR